MNNIPKETPISRVLPSNPLEKNAAHDRTASLLASQQNGYKHLKNIQKRLIPPHLLQILLAKLVSSLRGNKTPFPTQKSPFRKSSPNKQK